MSLKPIFLTEFIMNRPFIYITGSQVDAFSLGLVISCIQCWKCAMLLFFLGTGAFVGCSLQGSVVTTRTRENSRFYGSQSIKASEILLGSLPRPPAAAALYRALTDLYQKLWIYIFKCVVHNVWVQNLDLITVILCELWLNRYSDL